MLLGPLIDRVAIRRLLVGTQTLQLLGVLTIVALYQHGLLTVWLLIGVMGTLELCNQIVYPAQSAVLPRIVDDSQLARANAWFSMSYQGVDAIFNAVSGGLIALVGGTIRVFILDAVTFVIAIVAFWGLSIQPQGDNSSENDDEQYIEALTAGVTYLRGSLIPWLLGPAVIANFAFGVVIVTLPAFGAANGGAWVYGLLGGSMGAGRFVGTIIGPRLETVPYGVVRIVGSLLGCGALVVALLRSSVWLIIIAFGLSTIPSGAVGVLGATLFQTGVANDRLGRIIAIRNATSTLLLPLGAAIGGVLATQFSPAIGLVAMAGANLITAMVFGLHPRLRRLPAVNTVDEMTLGLADKTS
ncbi:MFS transporter [Halocatena halophila]|uniref:MFS transporter n=1 Tax=Halocatena halophila TaxID=2814576 RepID=UPI002ED317D3